MYFDKFFVLIAYAAVKKLTWVKKFLFISTSEEIIFIVSILT